MEKYYIVPARIIESNFPDDLEQIAKSCAIIVTEKSIVEIAEGIVRDTRN